jgi:hypothetical protein
MQIAAKDQSGGVRSHGALPLVLHGYRNRMLTSLLLAVAVAAPPPNIVIINADDLGYGDVGCYGATKWTTPHLDRLAQQGIRFTDFSVAQPVCSASRAALLTGCYPNRVGIAGALGPNAKIGLHERERTIGHICKAKGYATAAIGKWHLGHRPIAASISTSACRIRTTCGPVTRRPKPARIRTCRSSRG